MLSICREVTVIEPGLYLAKVAKRGINVVEKFLEVKKSDLPKGKKVFVSFELLSTFIILKNF